MSVTMFTLNQNQSNLVVSQKVQTKIKKICSTPSHSTSKSI